VNRWLAPSAGVLITALAVVAGILVPGQSLPVDTAGASSTRVSIVCPTVTSATASVSVATVTTGQALRTSKLSEPQRTTESEGLAVLTDPVEPVRVSAPRASVFGAATWIAASEGSARGLSGVSCTSPQADHWFAGVDVSADAQSSLVVVNLDSTEAVVDLTAYGPKGRLPASRGLRVPGNSASTISLQVIARNPDPVTVRVTTSQGRVAAFVRQFDWVDQVVVGADWVPDASAAGQDLVLSGLATGKGSRKLVVTNPGDMNASIAVNVLTANGTSELAGLDNLQVPPQTTRTFELADGLGGQAAGLHLSANQDVIAAVVGDNGESAAAADSVIAGVTTALPPDGVWPVAAGKSAASTLQLVNPGEQDATATVTTTTGSGAVKTIDVSVPAGSLAALDLPKASPVSVRIQTASTVLRASVVTTRKLGKVSGVAVLDLVADETRTRAVQVVHDPHLG